MFYGYSNVVRVVAACVVFAGCTSSTEVEPSGPLFAHEGIVADEDGAALAEVTICVHDRPDLGCAVTNARGAYALDVPEDATVLSYEADGFYPRLRMITAGMITAGAQGSFPMQSNHWLFKQVMRYGMDLEDEGGLVMLAIAPVTSGARFALHPEHAAHMLYYLNDDGDIDWRMSSTSHHGTALVFRVAPGDYEATLQSASRPHDVNHDTMSAPDAAAVHVESGYLTYAALDASHPAPTGGTLAP
jgi:hypothetical protein